MEQNQKTNKVPEKIGNNYVPIEIHPLSFLESKKEHRRLSVFFYKGVKCSNPFCENKGSQVICALGGRRKKELHIDVYTDNFILMTVDHIIPLSKKGSDTIDNKQPMCSECNSFKGNNVCPIIFGIKITEKKVLCLHN